MDRNVDMDNTKVIWEEFCNRFVAFFDIAGFKHFRKNSSVDEVKEMLIKMKDITVLQNRHFQPFGYLYIINISDSIIVFTKDDSVESFANFSHFIGATFNQILLGYRSLNGAVAYGKIYVDRDEMIFFGEAYENAYELQDKMNYYGIACHESINNYFSVNDRKQNPEYYYTYHSLYVELESYFKSKKENSSHRFLNFKWYVELESYFKSKRENSSSRFLNLNWYNPDFFDYTENFYCGDYGQRVDCSLDAHKAEFADMDEKERKKNETKILNTKKCCKEMYKSSYPNLCKSD